MRRRNKRKNSKFKILNPKQCFDFAQHGELVEPQNFNVLNSFEFYSLEF